MKFQGQIQGLKNGEDQSVDLPIILLFDRMATAEQPDQKRRKQ